jgi:hypothetical protein
LLSFFVGLISGADFGIVALRALISAVIFGGVTFAVQIIAGKFLFDSDIMDDEAAATGSTVDITIDDEPVGTAFQQEADAPVFDLKNIEPGEIAAGFAETGTASFRQNMAPASDEPESGEFRAVPLAGASVKRNLPPLKKENLDALTIAHAIRTMVANDKK